MRHDDLVRGGVTWFVHETSRKRSTRGHSRRVFFLSWGAGSRLKDQVHEGLFKVVKKKKYLDQPVGKASRERQVYIIVFVLCGVW